MMSPKLHRQISIFDRNSELMVGSVGISDATFKFIRTRLGVAEEDPMFDCYLIEGGLLQALQSMLGFSISETCDYFLDTEIEEDK